MIRIDGFPMDLALSEEHTYPGEVTEFPVEVGADTADHIRDLPPEITLECIVSDSPTGDIATDPTRQTGTGDALLAPGNELALPSEAALAKLLEIKARRRPVSVETSLGVAETMALLDVDVVRDKDKTHGLFFTAKFKRMNLVTNRRTRIRVKTPMAGAGGKAKAKVIAGVSVTIDKRIVWTRRSPPGSANKTGLSQIVEARYSKPSGMSFDEALTLGQATPSSSFVEYFFPGSPDPIVGEERKALTADLVADAAEKRAAQDTTDPVESARRALNLPDGLTLDRWTRPPPPPTFGPTPQDLDFSRFTTPRAPTFP